MGKLTASELMEQANALFGKGAVKLGSDKYFAKSFLPTGVFPIDEMLGGGLARGRFTEFYGNFCLHPDTLVLTADLDWLPLDAISVGDELVGFDEAVGQGRGKVQSYDVAVVKRLDRHRLPCYRIETDQGTVSVASVGHRWLVKHRTNRHREYRETQDLAAGDEIVWLGKPWDYEYRPVGSYIAGFMDGEGFWSGGKLGFGQNQGALADSVRAKIESLGYATVTHPHTSGRSGKVLDMVHVKGGLYEQMKFVGSLRPERLVAKRAWVGRSTASKGPYWSGTSTAKIVSVEPIGEQEVIGIETSTGTLIADGLLTHNSTLKSLVALFAIATTQKAGGVCVLIDTEHSFDPEWAESVGVNVDELLLQQPDTGEEAVDLTEAFVRAGVDLIVWDSVAATLPKAEATTQMAGDKSAQPARLAALMSAALRKLNTANKNTTAVLCINQIREKVGVVFGNNESVPGGRALPFYASIRVAMRKAGMEKREVRTHNGEEWKKTTEYLGQRIRATLEKSKLTAPHREVNFLYDFRTARVDEVLYVVGRGLELGLIESNGQTWTINSGKGLGPVRGRENFIEALRQSEMEVDWLKSQIMSHSVTDSPGDQPAPKRKAGKPKGDSSSSTEDESIPEAEPVESRTTGARRKKGSK